MSLDLIFKQSTLYSVLDNCHIDTVVTFTVVTLTQLPLSHSCHIDTVVTWNLSHWHSYHIYTVGCNIDTVVTLKVYFSNMSLWQLLHWQYCLIVFVCKLFLLCFGTPFYSSNHCKSLPLQSNHLVFISKSYPFGSTNFLLYNLTGINEQWVII